MILTHRANLVVPTFRINIVSLRGPKESRVATVDCCEIHHKIRVFLETFLIFNLPRNLATSAGIGTCTQSGMAIPSFLSSEMHLGKFPHHTEFQSWRVIFRTEVGSKAKNPCLALQWVKEIETANSMDDFITPKSITGKNFSDYEELDLMMAAALKKCYDKHTHTSVRK